MYSYFLEIDISKDSFDITLLDKSSKEVSYKKLTMDKDGFDKLLIYLKEYDKDKLLIAMEATGIYHLPLLSFLLDRDFKCVVINPILIKNFISSTTLRKTKNDKKDSSLIALFALKSHNLLKLSNKDLANISVLIKEREKLAKQVALLKTEIKANLIQLFPEILKNINIFTKSILNLLLKAPSAKAIRNFKEKSLDKILFDNKSGSPISITSKQILNLANSSTNINDLYLEKVLISKIRCLLNTYDEIDILDNEIDSSLKDTDINDNIEILKSILGIG